ncbi:[protein-PII] uridylyltransferase [Novimethylophilus kurashikiensis]|uniref:Bifunctional uridylyltransferase/uridylyl-removing enzyme n=1 Tax=Novimethylophilus kurashikiensis TaxID=1825523 RepID=A0A2R5F395_9PROT|nr:[protein-PII] uridylyltransferase [Novimethylophilus kurashikiensis]GBG13006.1 [protein-PII] uridylyltransferase [Novimethylophilus kurashikiensis]
MQLAILPPQDVTVWRSRLQAERKQLKESFERNGDAPTLLRGQCRMVDQLLKDIWKQFQLPGDLCLIAVGGYGRGELYPQSDVDLLFLLPEGEEATLEPVLEKLVGYLWDLGLAIGHSVRTLPECLEEASKDVTVQTNLIESRLLAGSKQRYQEFLKRVFSGLNAVAFFDAKMREQTQRHNRFNDTAYNLEPNLKESPGGLRDLQNIAWIARAASVPASWHGLMKEGLLSSQECRQIRLNERLLQNLRIRLHYLSNRREDRLLFDHQDTLARTLGLARSEHLMQQFYRCARFVSLMNEILLQSLKSIVHPEQSIRVDLDENFVARGHWLEARTEDLFKQKPQTILQAFLTLQHNKQLTGMGPATIRQLWHARHTINKSFRANPENRKNFMRILRAQDGILHALRRMHRYDVLGRYIPAFGRITGQMQHDLFHVYTVDEHTLNVMRNMRRYSEARNAHEFPLCSRLFSEFERPEVLYLAVLFHDIAKGRGGDHSTLGAVDAEAFCREHALPEEDAKLVVWLVEQHLLMSATAQHQDISDPEVIAKFARKMGDVRHLNALYLLTVADIRGTSPGVWNAWKSRLLESLYHTALRHLHGKLLDIAQEIAAKQKDALKVLGYYDVTEEACRPLWKYLDDEYFLKLDAKEIAWQTRLLLTHVETAQAIVRARLSPAGDGIQVMIYTRDRDDLFARICGFFERMGYNIVEARIHTTRHGYALDSFLILDQSDRSVRYSDLIAYIERELTPRLTASTPPEPPLAGRISRRLKHFPMTPSVTIKPDERSSKHVLSLVAGDRPGLLSRVAQVLLKHGASLHTARINTLGNRAEDTLMISGHRSATLPQREIEEIEQELLRVL